MSWHFAPQYVGQGNFPHPVFTPTPPHLSDPSAGDPHFTALVAKRQEASDAEFYATVASDSAIKNHATFDMALHGSYFAPGLDQAEALWFQVFTMAQEILVTPLGPMTASGIEWVKVNGEKFRDEASAHVLAVKALRAKVLAAEASPAPAKPAPAPGPGPVGPGPGPVTLPGPPGPLPPAPTPIPVPTEGDKTFENVGWLAAAGAVGYVLFRVLVRKS